MGVRIVTQTEREQLEGEAPSTSQIMDRDQPFIMNTAGLNKPNPSAASGYDQLLAVAQTAQAAADRAVADLAAVKRTMAEAPRVLQLRRDELARAQSALSVAENDYLQARENVTARQNEAARLIEAAADAQRALAQALISQDAPIPPAAMEALSARLSTATAKASPISPLPSPATLGPNRYTPTPAMHPADLHYEVVEYLRERDALCPSCGHSLRAIQSARCPGCKLQLSLKVLHSVRAAPWAASRIIWCVRALCAFAIVMSGYLTLVTFSGTKPFGCGGGSGCDLIMRSGWSKVLGIPVALFAVPLFAAIFAASFFQRVGLTDTTRKRSWTLLTGLGATAGLASLWFIAAQIIVFKSVCPHCLLVHLAGLATAVLILYKAPIKQPEKLPEPASGRIILSRRSAIIAFTFALIASAGFAALHGSLSAAKGPIDRNKILGIPDKGDEPDSGLLMKGLEAIEPAKPSENKPQNNPVPRNDSTNTPAPKPEEPAPGGLLLPGLDSAPPKSE